MLGFHIACTGSLFIAVKGLLQGNGAFHHRDVARERAEEAVFLRSVEFRHVKGHGVFLASTDDLGVGDHAGIAFLEVVLVDAGCQAIGGDRLHVSFSADHQVVAHDVLRQAAGVGQLDGECFAALVDFNGLGVEGHLVSGINGDLAFGSHQLAASQCQQGYRNKFGKHGESPRQG